MKKKERHFLFLFLNHYFSKVIDLVETNFVKSKEFKKEKIIDSKRIVSKLDKSINELKKIENHMDKLF